MEQDVWLITGVQASGKSTVADHLARRFDRGVHVRGGQFYRWAVQGWVHFDDSERQDEAMRLLRLRYRLSAMVATEYAMAGFTVVVQDNIYGPDVAEWMELVRARTKHLVVLRPSLDVVAERDLERRDRTGKVAYRGDYTIRRNDTELATTATSIGLWLDTSHQTAEETVNEILRQSDGAIVP